MDATREASIPLRDDARFQKILAESWGLQMPFRRLFESCPIRTYARGKEQIAVCIVKLDRGSISEAVVGGKL